MTIALSDDLIRTSEDTYRVRYATIWQADKTTWVLLPMQAETGVGFEVVRFGRRCLPDEGEAVLQFDYGRIDARDYAPTSMLDLRTYEIRIEQALPDTADPLTKAPIKNWKTVWKGQCVARNDLCLPGSTVPIGVMQYHCKDDLHRTAQWNLNRHQFWDGTTANVGDDRQGLFGHPGYNRMRGNRLVGNHKSTTPQDPGFAGFHAHTHPGANDADTWTDLQTVQGAIACATPRVGAAAGPTYLAPWFTVSDPLGALGGSQAWPIDRDTKLRDLLCMILDRRRGRGVAFADWDEAGDVLTPVLRIRAQFRANLYLVLPSGAVFNVLGADSFSATLRTVDLQGDCTLGEDGPNLFRLTEESETLYDRLVCECDRIRVLITVGADDLCFEKRYSATEITAYAAVSSDAHLANASRFHHVYRTWGLPLAWNFQAGKGLGPALASPIRCDYRTQDNGTIYAPTGRPSSPLLVSIVDDLPLYSGYTYAGATPARWDGANELSTPEALPVQVWIRASQANDRWNDAATQGEIHITRGGNDGQTDLTFHDSESAGLRFWERNAAATVALTIAVDLPDRLQMALNADGVTVPKKVKTLNLNGLALHLAHPHAIWSLDETTTSDGGFAARRQAGLGQVDGNHPGILRDDRDRLAKILYLAREWFLRPRNPVTYARDCGGFAGAWTDDQGTRHTFEQLGDFIGTLRYSGRQIDCNSPITGMDYDRATRRTTWIANWADFDWKAIR